MLTVHDKKSFVLYVAVAVVAVVLVNLIARNWFFRLDFTNNKMYSLSESSKKVINKTDDLLTLKVYFSDNLPGEYGNNQRYLQDILEEYEAYSNGNLRFEFYRPDDDEKLAGEARKYGIQPVQLQVIENDKLEIKRVYMGMVFLYEDQREVIPIIQSTTGLEYEITTKIKRLVDTEKETVGIASIEGQDVKNDMVSELLRQSYFVRPVKLDKVVPADIELLLINGVEDSLSTGEIEHLKDFIARGGNLFIAQSRVKSDLQSQRASAIKSNIFDLLDEYGLHLEENLVLDRNCAQVTVSQTRGFFQFNTAMSYPFFPLVRQFEDHPIVNGLEQVRLLFPSEISLSADTSESKIRPLFATSDYSSTMTNFFNLNPIENRAFRQLNQSGKVVAAIATVQPDTGGAVSQIILVGDSRLLADDGGGSTSENLVFVLNAVDYLIGDRELVALRSREITTRPLEDIEDDAKSRWKWANIILPPLLVIGLGLAQWKREARRSRILKEIYD